MINPNEEIKSFKWVYIGVAVFYAIMISVYGVVVHAATEDGAQDIACNPDIDGCNPTDPTVPIWNGDLTMPPLADNSTYGNTE